MGCTQSKRSEKNTTKPEAKAAEAKRQERNVGKKPDAKAQKRTEDAKPKTKDRKEAVKEVEADSKAKPTRAKETKKPDTKKPETKKAETKKPETKKPETKEPKKEPVKDKKDESKLDDLIVGKEKVSEVDGKHVIEFTMPNDDHKYVVGKGGENIKKIRAETNADVQLDPEKKKSDTIIITADSLDNAKKAKKLVIESVKAVKDQHNETEGWYQEFQKKVDEHAKKRQEYFDAAKKAHEDGDGKLAKELSEKGKKEGELMKQAQKDGAREVFKRRNKDNGNNVIDLHGLQVEPALEIVEEYLDKWSGKSGSYIIITGKGLHSDASGPKIRPAVEKLLKDKKMKYEDVPGQFDITV